MSAKLQIFAIGLLLGIILGYSWRFAQVEPQYDRELQGIHAIQKRISKDLYNLELKLAVLESKWQRKGR